MASENSNAELAVVVFQQQQAAERVRQTHTDALLRHMDLFMYVLYSGDENFVMGMVRKVAMEVCEKYACPELMQVIDGTDRPIIFKALFFLILNFYKNFRFWALSASLGLQPICPHKATRFLIALKTELVPQFLVDERVRLEEFERRLKVTYVAS